MRKVVIIIPTYNESGSIQQVVEGVFEQNKKLPQWELHILVVDSNSTDNTQTIVQKLQKNNDKLHLLKTAKEGLGKAYVNGFSYALEKLNPYLIFEMDADTSHDPKEIPYFIEEIEKGSDFVIGSRYILGGSIPKKWAWYRKVFSIFGNLIIRMGFMNLKITDWTDGYRAIKAWIVKDSLSHIQNYSGYVFQIALLDSAIRHGALIKEIPIQFKDREKGVSKINAIQYISHIIWYVFNHSSFIKFVIVGSIGFIIDFTFAYIFIHSLFISKPLANAMSAELAIISNFLLNNFWSFSHNRIRGGLVAYVKKFVSFNLTASGAIIILAVGMALLLKIFGDTVIRLPIVDIPVHSWIIYKVILTVGVIIPYSYTVYNKIIWRKKK